MNVHPYDSARKSRTDEDLCFDRLQLRHKELIECLPIKQGVCRTEASDSWMEEINEFVDDVSALIKRARGEQDLKILAWATGIANLWQMKMTTVFGIPTDIRDRLGIQPDDVFADILSWDEENLNDYLRMQSYKIGADRKLLRLVEKVRLFTLFPNRIHETIPSTPEECADDWFQASMFFALDALLGRLQISGKTLDNDTLQTLDFVFLDDVIRLNAYLAWEKKGAGWAPERASSFYAEAEATIHKQMHLRRIHLPYLRSQVSAWFKERIQLSPHSAAISNERIRRKARFLWSLNKQSDDVSNWVIAEKQTELFDQNIVLAIDEENQDSILAVAESVFGKKTRELAHCVTALEAFVVMNFVNLPGD